jgi:hypothetical protein
MRGCFGVCGSFPTHNSTHSMGCLVRLARSLAVPAILSDVIKPNCATLIRARSVVQVHPGPSFKHGYLCSGRSTKAFPTFPFPGISPEKPICQPFVNLSGNRTPPDSRRFASSCWPPVSPKKRQRTGKARPSPLSSRVLSTNTHRRSMALQRSTIFLVAAILCRREPVGSVLRIECPAAG